MISVLRNVLLPVFNDRLLRVFILLLASLLGGGRVCAQTLLISNGASWNACSGNFFDSGGATGNYGDNEDLVASLCPSGGPGSTPATSLLFTTWSIAPGTSDRLTIHDGTSTADPVLVVGDGLASLLGQTIVATGPTGCLTLHWESDGSVNAAGWSAHVTTGPNAGTNSAVSVCTNSAPFVMTSLLGGSPDPGGQWTAPGGSPHSATFDPASDPAGVYLYTVSGTGTCADSTASLTVTVNSPSDAGTSGSITVCSNAAPFPLFSQLGGAPQVGGAWTLGGTPVSSTFTPGLSTPGVYTYTVPGLFPCANASSTVTVSVVLAPEPGLSNSISICGNEPVFNLIDRLNGTPAAGGSWTGPGSLPHGPTFNPAVDAPGVYTYTVTGTAPCANGAATLTISVVPPPNAGTSSSIALCSTDGSTSLLGALGGSPDANGTWTAPGGGPHSGTFIPGTSIPGVYTYNVPGLSPCPAAVSTVTINVSTAPNAGINGSITVCSDAASFALLAQLGGTPNAGGSWTQPGGGAHTGTFLPGTNPAGVYTYTVPGTAPCAAATATVTVGVVLAPNPGTNASITKCSIDAPFGLFPVLGGSPAGGGAWTAPGGAPHSGTFIPGTNAPGVYTYTVAGTAPCIARSATVTVNVVNAANAGSNGSVTLCSTDPPTPLINHLGGSPQAGGSWTRPSGTSFGGTYDPANVNHLPGIYTYTVIGAAPCPNASATVLVTENQAPNAGSNGSTTVCSTSGAFALNSLLGGTPNGSGSWLAPGNLPTSSTFTPGVSAPGVYTYVVPGIAPCVNDSAFVTVNVSTAPNAGTNGALEICSNGAPVALLGLLGGTPDAGGTWTRPGGMSHSGVYDPAVNNSGVYTYTVAGVAPCANATASVTVSEFQQPNAGTSNTVQVCSNNPSFQLFNFLGGSPQTGGAWTYAGSPVSGTFSPGTSPAGVYTYTLTGTPPCTNATATITVTVNPAPFAGLDGELTICSDQGVVDLFSALGPTYDLGGTWIDQDGTGQLSGSFFNPAGLPPGTYNFRYEVPGAGPCSGDHAHVDVIIVSQLNAGNDGTANVCGSNANYNLFNCLGGSAQPGGTWIDLNATGALSGQFFNATLVPAGTYLFRYRLTGTLSCVADSSTATITVIAPPNAGGNGTASFCSNGPAVNLINFLTGSPQAGGSWNGPGPGPFTGFYNPATNNPGTYTYTVSGSPPCPSASATVTVSEAQAPNAGGSNAVAFCSNGPSVNMTSLLLGSPQAGGTWTNPSGQTVSATFVPGASPPGVYTYTVPGTFPCTNAVATLSITVNPAPNAGNNGTLTLCSNSGPAVLFNSLGGSPLGGGTWIAPGGGGHSGVFIPGVDVAGAYVYTVNGLTPCASAQATVTVLVNQAPNAGTSTSIELCSNGAAVDLFTLLGGTPDPTGSWTLGGVPVGSLFIPGVSTQGTYVYTVNGIAPCTSAQATVTVTVNAAPSAGASASIVVCSSQIAFPLIDALGGAPCSNGTWTAPGGGPFNGIFVPASSAPGVYQYACPGTPPCAPVTSTVTVVVNLAANAGADANLTLCSSSGSVPLFASLTGAQVGGTWTRPGGLPHSGIFNPAIDVPGAYTYTVNGLAPCVSDQSVVTVVVNQAPNAGSNGTITVCSNQFPFALVTVLNGSPGGGGTWTGPGGTGSNGIFIPGSSTPGVYTYTISGLPPCGNASATVTVFQNMAPNAGTSNAIAVCSDAASFPLVTGLLGSPNVTGSWVLSGVGPVGPTFVPGTSAAGQYVYTVAGAAPCSSSTATLTILQSTAANAGINTAVQLCSNSPAVPLVSLLGGTPQTNGQWFRPDGTLHGNNYNPALHPSGLYTYVVPAISPCLPDSSTVLVNLIPAPQAGTNAAVTACVGTSSIDLFDALGGTPQPGGTWQDVNGTGALAGNILNPSMLSPGTYAFVYTVTGNPPCVNASAQVTVTLTNALNAGTSSSAQVCQSQVAVDLFTLLGGTPQPGGNWSDDNASGALIGGVFNATAVPAGTTWAFTYTLPPSAGCASVSATVTVTVLLSPNAGQDGNLQVCSNGPIVNLGTPIGGDPGGTWYDPVYNVITGQFNPSSGTPGPYTYVVGAIGSCAADSAVVTISVTQAPNAGSNGSLFICSNQAPVALINHLGGMPQAGGNWVGPGMAPHSGVYNPVVDGTGLYVYTVTGQLPCANAVASVFVSEFQAPNAGGDNTIDVCSSQPQFNMRLFLGGSPPPGGSWFDATWAPHSTFFNPAVDVTGPYHYVLSGTSPCVNDTATLFVNLVQAANTGTGGTLNVCASNSAINLFNGLSGTPTPGGTWIDLGATGALTGNVFNPSLVGPGSYLFRYLLAANGPCTADSTTVTVVVDAGANPGSDSSVTICGGLVAYDLFQALGGSPDPGGIWIDLVGTGALSGSILNPSLLAPGTTVSYGYQVSDPGCGEALATVQVTVTTYPDPGAGTTVALCSTSDPVDLFTLLGGTPQTGGIWTDPNGTASGSLFTPGTSLPGAWSYTLAGTAPCNDSSSVVLVQVNNPANAGDDGDLLACNTSATLDLSTGLSNDAQPGGDWTDVGQTGQLNGNVLTVQGMAPGTYIFLYTVTVPGCGADVAQVVVEVVEGVTVSDLTATCNETDRTYIVSFVISGGDPATYSVTGVAGTLAPTAPYLFVSAPLFTSQPFSIAVDDQHECDPKVLEGVSPCDFEDEVFVPGSFSPNGDNINDLLLIPGIEGFPLNRLEIFNRWGDKVYVADGYDNAQRRWDGTSDRAGLPGLLPGGTYFFTLDLGNGSPVRSGYIQLIR